MSNRNRTEQMIQTLMVEVRRLSSDVQALRAPAPEPQGAVVVPKGRGRKLIAGGTAPPPLPTPAGDPFARPITTEDVARRLAVAADEAERELLKLKEAGAIVNVGSEIGGALWVRRVGDDTDVSELLALVQALITIRPMTQNELIAATGARRNRLRGVINRLKRDKSAPAINIGKGRKARWWIGPVRGR